MTDKELLEEYGFEYREDGYTIQQLLDSPYFEKKGTKIRTLQRLVKDGRLKPSRTKGGSKGGRAQIIPPASIVAYLKGDSDYTNNLIAKLEALLKENQINLSVNDFLEQQIEALSADKD